MKLSIFGGLLVTCAATIAAAQTGAKPSSTARQKAQTITMIGCVAAGPTAADPFTLATIAGNPPASGAPPAIGAVPPLGTTGTSGGDPNAGATIATGYRLSGASVKPYVGKRVQIVGGLVPSPNAAATAGAASSGAVPPTGADGAINSVPRTPTAPTVVALPEFRVVTVRQLEGGCPPR